MKIIYRRRRRRKKSIKPPPASVIAVVGLGESNFLLAPGAVIMSANGATMEAFRESEVLWFRSDHQQDPNYTFDSQKASISANPAPMEAVRESDVLLGVLLSSKGSTITLKAFMVTEFADKPREETKLLLMIRSFLQPP